MTLADLLQSNPPKPAADYSEIELAIIRNLWLAFPASLAAILDAEQAEHGSPMHRAFPIDLTDGRKALCADLLTEVAIGGIFASGFAALPADQFGNVEVISAADLAGLLPPHPES